MTKRTVQMSIDTDTIIKIKQVVDNVSGLVERLLKNYLTSEHSEETDALILEKKLTLARKEREKYAVQAEKLQEQVDTLKKDKEEETIKRLELSKQQELKATQCVICGNVVGVNDKATVVGGGIRVHSSCFLLCDKKQIDKLTEGD